MPEFTGSPYYNDGYDIVREALSVLEDYMDEMDEEEVA